MGRYSPTVLPNSVDWGGAIANAFASHRQARDQRLQEERQKVADQQAGERHTWAGDDRNRRIEGEERVLRGQGQAHEQLRRIDPEGFGEGPQIEGFDYSGQLGSALQENRQQRHTATRDDRLHGHAIERDIGNHGRTLERDQAGYQFQREHQGRDHAFRAGESALDRSAQREIADVRARTSGRDPDARGKGGITWNEAIQRAHALAKGTDEFGGDIMLRDEAGIVALADQLYEGNYQPPSNQRPGEDWTNRPEGRLPNVSAARPPGRSAALADGLQDRIAGGGQPAGAVIPRSLLGQATDDDLREAGYTDEEITAARRSQR
jgi:hypothetical protein